MARLIQASDVRWATARSLIASIATVGGAILVARGLPPADAGHYQFAEMMVLTGATVINAGKADTGLRFAAAVPNADSGRIGRDLLTLTLGSCLLVALAAVVASVLGWQPLAPGWLPWLGLAAMGAGISLVLFGLLQGWGAYRRLAVAQAIVMPGRLLVGLAVLLTGGGLAGLLVVLIASHVIGALVLLAAAQPHLTEAAPALAPELRARLRRYRLQMAVLIALTLIVWERSEFFFLAHYQPPEALAFYGAAFALAAFAMKLLPSVVGGLLTPRAASLGAEAHGEITALYCDGTRYLFAIAWPVALVGSCFAGSVLSTIYGETYRQAAWALPPLLLGAGAGAVAAAEVSVKFGIERPDLLLRVGVSAAAANLLLDWLLIPSYGWLGAAWANALAQLAAVVAGARVTCRLFQIRFPWGPLLRAALAGLTLVPLWLGLARLDLGFVGLVLGALTLLTLYPLLLIGAGFVTEQDRQRWRDLWRWRPMAQPRRQHAYRD